MSKVIKITHSNIENYKFLIKEYQREFVWNFKQIKKLLDSYNNDIFVGVGVAAKYNEKRGENITKSNIEVIDGQQRLISSMLLFGHLKNILTKIEFEFYDDGVSEMLNSIFISTTEEEIDSLLKEDSSIYSYARKIGKLKKECLKLPKEKLEKVAKKFAIVFYEIDESKIDQTFIALNNTGTQVGVTNLYKANYMIKNNEIFNNNLENAKDEKEKQKIKLKKDLWKNEAKKIWTEILELSEKICSTKKMNALVDDIFTQSYNSIVAKSSRKDRKSYPTKGGLYREIEQLTYKKEVPKKILNSFKWADRNMISKLAYRGKGEKRINTMQTFGYISLNNKPFLNAIPLLMSISKEEEERKEYKKIYLLLAIIINFTTLNMDSNIPLKDHEEKLMNLHQTIKQGKKEEVKKEVTCFQEYIFNWINNKIKNNQNRFDFEKIQFRYSNNKNNFLLQYNSRITKCALSVYTLLRKIDKKNTDEPLEISEFNKWIKTFLRLITSAKYNIDHIKTNKKESKETSSFNNLTIITKDLNEALKNKTGKDRKLLFEKEMENKIHSKNNKHLDLFPKPYEEDKS